MQRQFNWRDELWHCCMDGTFSFLIDNSNPTEIKWRENSVPWEHFAPFLFLFLYINPTLTFNFHFSRQIYPFTTEFLQWPSLNQSPTPPMAHTSHCSKSQSSTKTATFPQPLPFSASRSSPTRPFCPLGLPLSPPVTISLGINPFSHSLHLFNKKNLIINLLNFLCSAVETKVPARGKALVATDISIAIPEGTYARVGKKIFSSI